MLGRARLVGRLDPLQDAHRRCRRVTGCATAGEPSGGVGLRVHGLRSRPVAFGGGQHDRRGVGQELEQGPQGPPGHRVALGPVVGEDHPQLAHHGLGPLGLSDHELAPVGGGGPVHQAPRVSGHVRAHPAGLANPSVPWPVVVEGGLGGRVAEHGHLGRAGHRGHPERPGEGDHDPLVPPQQAEGGRRSQLEGDLTERPSARRGQPDAARARPDRRGLAVRPDRLDPQRGVGGDHDRDRFPGRGLGGVGHDGDLEPGGGERRAAQPGDDEPGQQAAQRLDPTGPAVVGDRQPANQGDHTAGDRAGGLGGAGQSAPRPHGRGAGSAASTPETTLAANWPSPSTTSRWARLETAIAATSSGETYPRPDTRAWAWADRTSAMDARGAGAQPDPGGLPGRPGDRDRVGGDGRGHADLGRRGDRGGPLGDRAHRVQVGQRVSPALMEGQAGLGGRVGVAERRAQREPVELALDQRERAELADRVLGGQHQVGLGERPGLPVHRHLLLVHRLEQGRLGARRGPVELVEQHHVAEHRSPAEVPVAGPLVVDGDAGHIARQQVRMALDSRELGTERDGQGAGEHGLAHPRDVLDEQVAARQGRHDRHPQRTRGALHDAGQVGVEPLGHRGGGPEASSPGRVPVRPRDRCRGRRRCGRGRPTGHLGQADSLVARALGPIRPPFSPSAAVPKVDGGPAGARFRR